MFYFLELYWTLSGYEKKGQSRKFVSWFSKMLGGNITDWVRLEIRGNYLKCNSKLCSQLKSLKNAMKGVHIIWQAINEGLSYCDDVNKIHALPLWWLCCQISCTLTFNDIWRRFCIIQVVAWTYRHFRWVHRTAIWLLSRFYRIVASLTSGWFRSGHPGTGYQIRLKVLQFYS